MAFHQSNDHRGHVKFLVYYKTKADRADERTLVFTDYSIQVSYCQGASTKSVVKIEHIIPFIDILTIESNSKDKLTLTSNNSTHNITTRSAENVDDIYLMVRHIVDSLQKSFPSVVVEKNILKLELNYSTRATDIESHLIALRQKLHVGPCGGFKSSHEYFRVYFNTPKQDEVVWDVETVYVSQNTKRMTLRDFDHLEWKDWLPIIACTAFNSYFSELDVSNLKLNNECQNQVIYVLKRNKNIEALYMDNCGLKSDFCQRFGQVITSDNRLSVLDLSNNVGIEDRGLSLLCGLLSKLKKTLTAVKLRGCGLTAKSANYLGEALISASGSSAATAQSVLKTLDLSCNSLKGEDLQSFFHFLAQPNSITHLLLSHCDCTLDGLFQSMIRGCTSSLASLDLSYTVFSTSVPPSWNAFFQTALMLRTVNLSHTKLGHQALSELLDALNKNSLLQPSGVELDISGNELKSVGAGILAKFMPDSCSISSLNISDNDFNSDLILIFQALESNTKLVHLTVGANFGGLKPKQITSVMESLCQLITSSTSSLSSLSLADAKLKGDIYVLIDELANNNNLRHLNICGNLMGDVAARILSRVLCVNTTLEELIFDRNNLSLRSIEEIVGAVEHNYTLQRLALPVCDLNPFIIKNSDRVAQIVSKFDSIMKRNHGPKKFSSEKAFKISQSFVMSTTQQYLDQLMVSLEQNCARLERSGIDDPHSQEIIVQAKGVLEDARASRNFLSRLQSVSSEVANCGGEEIQKQIKVFSKDLNIAVERLLQQILDEMILVAKTDCPHVFKREELVESAKTTAVKSIRLPKDFVKKLLSRTLDSEISYKVEEISLDLASSVGDSVFDSLLHELDNSLQHLTKSWTRLVRAQKRNTSSSTTSDAPASREGSVDSEQNGDSPVSLRKVVVKKSKDQKESHVNRRRPRSSVLSMHDDDDDDSVKNLPSPLAEQNEPEIKATPPATPTSPTSPKKKENSPKKSPSKLSLKFKESRLGKMSSSKSETSITKDSKQMDLEVLPELTDTAPLDHQNKARPKRPKQNSSKKVVSGNPPLEGSQDSLNSASETPRCVEDIFRYCTESTQPLMNSSAMSSREQTPDSLESEEDTDKKSRTGTPSRDSPARETAPNPMRSATGMNILAELRQKQENKRASQLITETKSAPSSATKVVSTETKPAPSSSTKVSTETKPVPSSITKVSTETKPVPSSTTKASSETQDKRPAVLGRMPPSKDNLPVLRPVSQMYSNERASTSSTASDSSTKQEGESSSNKPMSVKERANMITAMANQSGSSPRKPNLPPKPKSFRDSDDRA